MPFARACSSAAMTAWEKSSLATLFLLKFQPTTLTTANVFAGFSSK